MKAYVTSIGEKTTDLVCHLLTKQGFEVVLLDQQESWFEKYKRFINMADGNCFRIDADTIPSQLLRPDIFERDLDGLLMAQFNVYDLYRRNVGIGGGLFYTKKAIDIIKNNLGNINPLRPEATAWRLPQINDFTYTSSKVIGCHGFYQDFETVDRAKENKENRGQIDDYDFSTTYKLLNL